MDSVEIYEKARKVPECTVSSEHGIKLTWKTSKMMTFYSTVVDESLVVYLYRRCDTIVEGGASAGCCLRATKAREVVAAKAIIALLKFKRF